MKRANGKPLALVVMAPLREGHEEHVLSVLAAMPTGSASPFARVTSTHFCRWLVVPALLGGDREPVEPAQSYLLFTADFDGSQQDWAAEVTEKLGAEVERVFEHCDGYPKNCERDAFLEFIDAHRIDVGFSVRSYDATVAEIRRSLQLRSELREFAAASQGLAPSELRGAWTERFGG